MKNKTLKIGVKNLFFSKISKLVISTFALAFIILSCDKGQVIETISGKKIYDKDYEKYYATSVDLASRMAGADETFLSRMVCDEESQLSAALKPSGHYERFRDAMMVAQVAEKEGFLKRSKNSRNVRTKSFTNYRTIVY